MRLESTVSSSPSKNAKVNLKICVFLLLYMNLQLDVLQEGENRVGSFADRVVGRMFVIEIEEVKECWKKQRD